MPPVGSGRVRHPGDVLRAFLGTVTLAISGIAARRAHPGRFEVNLFRLVNDLPNALAGVLGAIMQLGSLAAVPIVAGLALLLRRVRMAFHLAVSGGVAWLLAKAVKDAVERGRPATLLEHVATRGVEVVGQGFPSGHVAVAAALATTAAPYLPRPARRSAWVAVALVAVARINAGAHLPLDALGGAALGWTVGATLHLLLGAPERRPPRTAVQRALANSGIDVLDVDPASVDARGSTAFEVRCHTGPQLFVKVVSREQRNADLLFKAWRFLAFREVEDEAPFATPKQQVEHEAYLALLATRSGVRTPPILASGVVEGAGAFIAEEFVVGRTLDTVPPREIRDTLLIDICNQIRLLHKARLAHRDLRRANLMIDRSGKAWILDFGFAEAAATKRRLGQDVAELLTSLALVSGAKRALWAANETLGRHSLVQAVPFLQPLALSVTTRHELKAQPGLLGELRGGIASVVAEELPPVQPLTRIRVKTVLLLLATAIAVHLLLPQVGELGQTFRALASAQPVWLLAGLLASALSYVMAAIALAGAAGRTLPIRRTVAVQVASSFANRLVPGGFGGLGTNARYLEGCGSPRPDALAAVGLNAASGVAVHVAGLVLSAALLGGRGIGAVHLPSRWVALLTVVAVLTLAGVVWWSPRVRERIVEPGRQAARALASTARQPRQAMRLFGGCLGVTASYALTLIASLHAFGEDASVVQIIAVYLGASAVASVSPTPGGLGALEAALVAGLTAVGLSVGPAVAGVLAFRLLTFWLPILPGIYVFRYLSRRGVI
jgi:undecaprenyl-diphosphatase